MSLTVGSHFRHLAHIKNESCFIACESPERYDRAAFGGISSVLHLEGSREKGSTLGNLRSHRVCGTGYTASICPVARQFDPERTLGTKVDIKQLKSQIASL